MLLLNTRLLLALARQWTIVDERKAHNFDRRVQPNLALLPEAFAYGHSPIASGCRHQLNRRRLHVDSLVPDDTAEYLRVRLHGVGCDRALFASDAVAMLHEATLGALRDIDRLATAALREAAKTKRKLVERDTLARVVEADAREAS